MEERKMNIIKMKRVEKGITTKQMGLFLNMNESKYLELEIDCNFEINDYFKICDILGIDFNTHL